MISASAILGVAVGAINGGKFMKYGRRTCLILFNILNAIAVAITMFLNIPCLCVGRLLFGFCAGVI